MEESSNVDCKPLYGMEFSNNQAFNLPSELTIAQQDCWSSIHETTLADIAKSYPAEEVLMVANMVGKQTRRNNNNKLFQVSVSVPPAFLMLDNDNQEMEPDSIQKRVKVRE